MFALPLAVSAQQLHLHINAEGNEELLKASKYQQVFYSTAAREKELQRILLFCYDNAYLIARYDSIYSDSINMTAWLNAGKQYKWAKLSGGNVDEGVLSQTGFREKLYRNKPVSYKDVKRIEERIIRYYEDNGYPFASVGLDSIDIQEGSLTAQLHLEKFTLQKIDSVVILGNAKISPVYIYNYLGIRPGALYNESALQRVNARLRELPFLSVSKPANVIFTNRYNKLVLFLEKKRASQFDGILGILPDNNTGKVLFTGDVRLKLQNGLGHGELIDLNWKRLQTQTQDLRMHLVYPFLLRTPFGIDYNFRLYKKDTTYLDVHQDIGLQYLLTGGNFVKIFYRNKSSSLLSTKGLEFATVLPPYADVHSNLYGIGLFYEKLDYRLNPRKGFSVTVNTGAGTRVIRKNSKLNPELYQDLKLNSTQYNSELAASFFIPFGNRSTIKIADQSAMLSGEAAFQNELFRIGGLRSLRGFDEESIYASAYSIFSLEYHFLLEQNSYLYVFGDQAWYESRTIGSFVTDTPTGFGAGISFETKAGIFSINYALGRQFDNPVQLRGGKIHFGIVNYF